MKSLSPTTIEKRLNNPYYDQNNQRVNSPTIFPPDKPIHTLDLASLQRLPRYLIESNFAFGRLASVDMYRYWGWTAAALPSLKEVVATDTDLPEEIYPENWDGGASKFNNAWVPGVVWSRISQTQSALRIALLHARMEITLRQQGPDELPTKAALLSDLLRSFDYMSYGILEGITSTALSGLSPEKRQSLPDGQENLRHMSWGQKLLAFASMEGVNLEGQYHQINSHEFPSGYLPSTHSLIIERFEKLVKQEGVEIDSVFSFFTSVRNRTYHEARDSPIGRYILTLLCSSIWSIISENQYERIRQYTLHILNNHLEEKEEFVKESNWSDYCFCQNNGYLEFYPVTTAELGTDNQLL